VTQRTALPSTGDADSDLTHSTELLARFQAGDASSLERLWGRYLPRLKRWAHGRLPASLRDATATDDLVQEAFVRSLSHLKSLQPRGPQSLFCYFRTIIFNQIRNYLRQQKRRPRRTDVDFEVESAVDPTPLEQLISAEALDRYDRARATLSESDQDIIVSFVELRCTDAEIAELLDKPSVDAARMARGRAISRLARAMREDKL
jgi:RNA polymerase sigma-70 factor, ECF subfamily